MFHDVYNAVKHGNRAIPQTQNELQFIPDKSDNDADGVAVDVAVDMAQPLASSSNAIAIDSNGDRLQKSGTGTPLA